jgi:hypothetical protein
LSGYPQTLAALEAWLAAIDQYRNRLAEQLGGLLDATERHIEEGELKVARSTFGNARRLDRGLGEHPHQAATARIGARLGELADWSKFATLPKREELITVLEQLVATPRTPPEQAGAIKRARADWIALGPVGRDERELDERFNALAEQAFEPCRDFFREQSDLRKRNLEARGEICEQLEHYLAHADWAQPDLRGAERILRTARDEWRAHHPVEREAGRLLQQHFDSLQDSLSKRVKDLRAGNEQAKRDLVEAARVIATSDEPPDARIDAIKRLQQEWKSAGPLPHRLDQELWLAFRAECDRIFTARDAARDADRTALEAAGREAEQLVSAFEQRASDVSRAAFDQLRAALTALGEMPREQERALRERMTALAEHVRSEEKGAARRERMARLEALLEADCRALPAADGGPGGNDAEARFGSTDPGHAALRRLTVRAEILAGMESPSADQALRLEIQVEELNRSLKQQPGVDDSLELAQIWCRTPGEGPRRDELRTRAFAAFRILETRSR